jgi:hypothetical protein
MTKHAIFDGYVIITQLSYVSFKMNVFQDLMDFLIMKITTNADNVKAYEFT